MIIIHVCSNYNTKLEYQEQALVREQVRQNHKVYVITSSYNRNYKDYDSTFRNILGERYIGEGVFREDGYIIVRLKPTSNDRVKRFYRLKGIKKYIRKIKPDLVICHGIEVGLLPLQVYSKKYKIIIDSHYVESSYEYHKKLINKISEKVSDFILWFKIRLLRNKSNIYFVGVTEDAVERFIQFGVKQEKVKLIPLGTDLNLFKKDGEARKQLRAKYNIPDDGFVIITTGKIDEYKGTHLILEAVGKLNNDRIFLFIVGKIYKNYYSKLYGLINKYNIAKKIFFIEYLDKYELSVFFNIADIAVYPMSITISQIDAMAYAIPVIMENRKSVLHRVASNNGILIRKDSIEDLFNSILYLFLHPEKKNIMGLQSMRLVQERLNWSVINSNFLNYSHSKKKFKIIK